MFVTHPQTLAASELRELSSELDIPAHFADHRAQFTVETVTRTFHSPQGETKQSFIVVSDNGKPMAIYQTNMEQLALLVNDPAQAPSEIDWPARYHWATFDGCRMMGVLWYDGQYASGDERERTTEIINDGSAVRFTITESWKRKRTAQAVVSIVIRCDPVLGYIAESTISLETNDARNQVIEFNNVQPAALSDLWPGADGWGEPC